MSREQIKIIFGRITEDFLYPFLGSKGYQVGSRGWYRKDEGDNEYYVAPSLSRYRPGGPNACIFVGAGVGFQKLWKFMRRCDLFVKADRFSVAGCGGLINQMFPRTLHPTWSLIDETSDPEPLGREMQEQFEQYVFPYIEYYSNIDHAIGFWRGWKGQKALAAVAATFLRGRREQAFAELEQLIADAAQEYAETQKPGHAERLTNYRRFKQFLESADMAAFRY